MNTPKPQSFSRQVLLSGQGRLDALLRRAEIPETPWLSRSVWEYLFNFKYVRDEAGRPLKPGLAVERGQTVQVEFPGKFLPDLDRDPNLLAKPIYTTSDGSWGAFVKPAGIPSFPRYPWERGTFVEQVAGNDGFYNLGPPPSLEGGLVQRLDVGTSGAMLVAYDETAKNKLRDLLSSHSLLKTYHAIVHGNAELEGENHTFYLSQASPERMIVDDRRMMGRSVDAWIRTILRTDEYSLVEFQTKAGVRHQVRAILAKLGHPLVGDALYGKSDNLPHHCLHASTIEFPDSDPLIIRAPETDFFRSQRARLNLN